uniref:PDZ domain-containing protein n=1 Tax=Esox lucius TaxID=8010 RepID=A0A6Q2YXS9_ESOLU
MQCLRMSSKRNLFVRLVPCRCLRGEEETVTSLDYSHCSLETVPKEIFGFEKTLEELYLDANQIEELPKQLFNCQLLHRLSMPDNDLTVLPAAIANLINLKELDISKNSIQEFPENIKNCKVLTIVEASVNPISKLPEGFTQLLSLTQLYLNDAFLEFLPASFGRLTKLLILELRENQLKMLPKSMHKLTQLERLDLGSNEFTEVPEVLEQLTGIKELWLDGNRLTFLPGMLGTLKQLSYLDVSKNNLEMVDERISGCENLQDLLLSNNALTQLPGSIGSLKKLTALKVDENQLMYLPDSIGGLVALDELDCSFNEIEALPSSIGQCVSLRTFAADHNFLAQLPPEMGSWKNATVLFLHSNKLESLPEEMGDMTKLKVINLSDNKLRNLPYSFTKLNQMTAMWLSENQSKPLIPLQKEEDPETNKTVLTNYMFPQQTRTEEYIPNSDSESFNPSLWEEQRKQRAQVAFECDEDKDERETPPRVSTHVSHWHGPVRLAAVSPTGTALSVWPQCLPLARPCPSGLSVSHWHGPVRLAAVSPTGTALSGNLKRYPTPYPDELKNMVKTAQSVAHRLKEDESGEESGRDARPNERNHVGVQDVGVKVGLRFSLLTVNTDNMVDDRPNGLSAKEAFHHTPPPYKNDNSATPFTDHVENGNQLGDHIDSCSSEGLAVSPMRVDSATSVVRTASAGVTASSDTSLSRSTEELSPERQCPPSVVAKAWSVTNIEAGGMQLYSVDGEGGSYEGGVVGRMAGAGPPGPQGQSIVRSKSASLLNDQPFQVYPGSSASSSDLLSSSSKPPVSTSRHPVPSCMAMGPPPQYNVQYTSSAMPKDGLWTPRTPVPPDQGYLPTPQHSLANTNYSNRNQAPPYPFQAQQRGPPAGPKLPVDIWAKERHLPLGGQPRSSTLQRQSSSSSTASMGDPRRVQVPDGDYMTYRDIHTLGRGPLAMAQAMQRPLSARTYSMDVPGAPRPHSARPQPHELPERTMSVSDFNYQHVSPSKRPNARVKSEHSLLDGPGGPGVGGRVPVDWRDQVMRHIEAKKMEKVHLKLWKFRSQCCYCTVNSLTMFVLLFSCVCFCVRLSFQVPLMNGQMGGPVRSQAPMARHPSREQLIDYLMLKVSHAQPPQGPPPSRAGHDTLQQEEYNVRVLQIRVKVEKNPELGFSISGGVGGRGNPFHPDDNGIFVTRVQPEGPASKIVQPGDKILQVNGYSFVNIDHGNAVALLKTFPSTVDMIIVREVAA